MDVIDVVDATYIVMERIDGPELTDFIEMQPHCRIDSPLASLFLGQMLSALRHAHSRGLLHCDLKPQNVYLAYISHISPIHLPYISPCTATSSRRTCAPTT